MPLIFVFEQPGVTQVDPVGRTKFDKVTMPLFAEVPCDEQLLEKLRSRTVAMAEAEVEKSLLVGRQEAGSGSFDLLREGAHVEQEGQCA